ncbi:MAG TPA: adenylate/guanylate cyclase domain-containing protein [Gaiellaceae bacterium]|nr:adenylate/guanylate cyclase domain-containing protein [Gaiellaceae bacterium]
MEPASERELRKLVTVFFCDLVESTALGERHDPELVRHVLSRYFEAIEQLIVAHGGTVEKFVGDAVMAIFGLPTAHEDDALRAVKVAAQLQERLPPLAEETGFALSFRIGITSGEVVVGTGQTLATGDPINVAARLEQEAAPGEILLGAETVRLLGTAIETELLAPLELHGKASPVEASRFRRLVAESGREPPLFVGRERELAQLAAAFRQTVQQRELHLLTVLGPAGIGKSALAAEFLRSLDGRARRACGRCLSYGQALSYWPLLEVLRELGEPAAPALERLVEGGATSPEQLAWTVQQALEQAAGEQPLVVVVEDLHWAEAALLDLLALVCDRARGAPILLLCLARPELLEQRPGWGQERGNEARLLLEPLQNKDCERLLGTFDSAPPSSERQRVLDLADGNPLFIEELSAFVAEGGEVGRLPPRIHALLQARLDLLPEAERVVLTSAALEGTVFHHRALDALVPNDLRAEMPMHLATLTRKLLIRPAHPDIEGEHASRFRHQLIRDAAYGALSKSDRARLHQRFATWVEQFSGDRPELEDIRAYHLEQAALAKREVGAPEPALEQRAASALAEAGERARSRTDLGAAADLWRRALVLFDELDPGVPELKLRLAVVLAPLGDFAGAQRLLVEAARDATDPVVAAAVRLAGLSARLQFEPEGVPPAIRREAATAIPLFERRGDPRHLALAWTVLGEADWIELQLRAATDAWERAATQAELAGDRAAAAYVLSTRLLMLPFRLPWSTVVAEAEQLAARFPGEPIVERAVGFLRVLAAYEAGRRDEARARADDVLDQISASYPLHTAIFNAFFAWEELLAGDLVEAERRAFSAIGELHGLTERGFRSFAETFLGEIRIAQGRHREALELADQAEKHGGPHDRGTLIAANAVRAHAHAALGEVEAAKAAAETADAIAGTTDSLADQARARYALAVALAAAGDSADALAAANDAVRLHTFLERPLLSRRPAALAEQLERDLARSGRRGQRARSFSA